MSDERENLASNRHAQINWDLAIDDTGRLPFASAIQRMLADDQVVREQAMVCTSR